MTAITTTTVNEHLSQPSAADAAVRDDRQAAVVGLPMPSSDPAPLWDLGMHGVPLTQYVRWADETGLLTLMAGQRAVTREAIVAGTPLTARGAEALVTVLCALGLARWTSGSYVLEEVARDYLDRRAPFYIGPSLYGPPGAPLPPQLRKGEAVRRYSQFTGTLRDWFRYWRKPNQFGRREQLWSQHRRNLPTTTVAAGTGLFDGIRHLADIGGGSGAFAIPLLLRDPALRVTLVDLPRALPHVPAFLRPHGVEHRVTLRGLNVHRTPWPLDGCDGVLFGNILHFCDDEESLALLRESRRILPPGGRVLLHEMLLDDDRSGPLATALWNFWMTTISSGRQRTARELADLLAAAGFEAPSIVATAGGFSLMTATAAEGRRSTP